MSAILGKPASNLFPSPRACRAEACEGGRNERGEGKGVFAH